MKRPGLLFLALSFSFSALSLSPGLPGSSVARADDASCQDGLCWADLTRWYQPQSDIYELLLGMGDLGSDLGVRRRCDGVIGRVSTQPLAGTAQLHVLHLAIPPDGEWLYVYTADEAERARLLDQGWVDDGLDVWYVAMQPGDDRVPLYRLYSPARDRFFFTTSEDELRSYDDGWSRTVVGYVWKS